MPNDVIAVRISSILDQLFHCSAQGIYQGGVVPGRLDHGAGLTALKPLQVGH